MQVICFGQTHKFTLSLKADGIGVGLFLDKETWGTDGRHKTLDMPNVL